MFPGEVLWYNHCMKIQGYIFTATLLGGLATGSASAQQVPSSKASVIDFNALTLLKQSAAAYQALHSYSCDVDAELKVDSLPGSRSTRLRIQFQKPDRAAVSMTRYEETQQFFTDGKQVYLYLPAKKQYRAKALPPDIPAAAAVLTQGESYIGLMLMKPNGLLTNDGNIESLTVGSPEMQSGTLVQTVTKIMRGRNGGHLTFFVSIGTKDHLIHRFASTIQSPTPLPVGDGKAKRVDNIEVYTDVQANPTLPALTFLPPADAKSAEPYLPDKK